MPLVLRNDKGSALTHAEMDGNFTHLDSTKQAALVAGTNIKTINGQSPLGSGDLEINVQPNLLSDWSVTNYTEKKTLDFSGAWSAQDLADLLGTLINTPIAIPEYVTRREIFPTIANNATDPARDLDIGAARIFVEDGSGNSAFVEFAARTKQIDAAWVAGDDVGGLDIGSPANSTYYYIWAVWNPTSGVADYLISTSVTSPTMPSGFTYKRRVYGAVLTDGSANVRGFRQVGEREFYFTATNGIVDLNQTSSFTVNETARTLSVPPNFMGIVQAVVVSSVTNTLLQVYPTNAGLQHNVYRSTAGVGDRIIRIPVDSSRQIFTKLNDVTNVTTVYLATFGIEDTGV